MGETAVWNYLNNSLGPTNPLDPALDAETSYLHWVRCRLSGRSAGCYYYCCFARGSKPSQVPVGSPRRDLTPPHVPHYTTPPKTLQTVSVTPHYRSATAQTSVQRRPGRPQSASTGESQRPRCCTVCRSASEWRRLQFWQALTRGPRQWRRNQRWNWSYDLGRSS